MNNFKIETLNKLANLLIHSGDVSLIRNNGTGLWEAMTDRFCGTNEDKELALTELFEEYEYKCDVNLSESSLDKKIAELKTASKEMLSAVDNICVEHEIYIHEDLKTIEDVLSKISPEEKEDIFETIAGVVRPKEGI